MAYSLLQLTLTDAPDGVRVAASGDVGTGGLAATLLDSARLGPVLTALAAYHGGATDRGSVAALGRGLFDWLFVPALRDLYEGVRGRLAAGDRLRLLLRTDSPDLAAMPWELLCHTATNEFLTLDPAVSVTRYLPRPLRPPRAPRSGPLRILAVFAGPKDQGALDLARELSLIALALRDVDPAAITYDVLMDPAAAAASGLGVLPKGPPTPAAFTDALAEGYDLLHYGGHGALTDDGGVLVLEDAQRASAILTSEALAVAVRGSRLRAAILSACQTASPVP
jgi:hypothetical protein